MICVTGAGGTVGSELIKQLEFVHVPFRATYFSPEKVEHFKGVTNCFFSGRTCRTRRSSNSMRSRRQSRLAYDTS
jgi:aspartate-semialdehyde dehydrogenase